MFAHNLYFLLSASQRIDQNRLVKCDEDLWGDFEPRFALATDKGGAKIFRTSAREISAGIYCFAWVAALAGEHLPTVVRRIHDASHRSGAT